MILAIDYDGTWAREPDIFRSLVTTMLKRGHVCVVVTGRSEDDAPQIPRVTLLDAFVAGKSRR